MTQTQKDRDITATKELEKIISKMKEKCIVRYLDIDWYVNEANIDRCVNEAKKLSQNPEEVLNIFKNRLFVNIPHKGGDLFLCKAKFHIISSRSEIIYKIIIEINAEDCFDGTNTFGTEIHPIIASTIGTGPWDFSAHFNPTLISRNDLVLYTNFPYLTPRFWELLGKEPK